MKKKSLESRFPFYFDKRNPQYSLNNNYNYVQEGIAAGTVIAAMQGWVTTGTGTEAVVITKVDTDSGTAYSFIYGF